MKKNLLFTIIAGCLYSNTFANQSNFSSISEDSVFSSVINEQDIMPLTPTYLDGVYEDGGWGANWFLSLQAGANAFIGEPVGCGDIGDRTNSLLNASIGKWFSPFVGGRISFQGMRFKDSFLRSCKFQNVHADFLYNISSHYRRDVNYLARWDVIPYAGVGIIRNEMANTKPFEMSYGLIARYRLAKRLHLSTEIGGTTTFRNFDGIGETNKFGDNLLHASIGLTLTVGKVGWKRVIDAKPYIRQNDLLIDCYSSLKSENEKLSKQLAYDEMALQEMRKILEIEGLLKKYNIMEVTSEYAKNLPKNNYSGLNSLRARLRNRTWNGDEENYTPMLAENYEEIHNENTNVENNNDENKPISIENYIKLMKEGKAAVGAPIYFFFRRGTDNLNDVSQEINAKEIAKVIKMYNLHCRVIGSADSATGSAEINQRLSEKRASKISKLLRKYDVPEHLISTVELGGNNKHEPAEGNRNTCVVLYTK